LLHAFGCYNQDYVEEEGTRDRREDWNTVLLSFYAVFDTFHCLLSCYCYNDHMGRLAGPHLLRIASIGPSHTLAQNYFFLCLLNIILLVAIVSFVGLNIDTLPCAERSGACHVPRLRSISACAYFTKRKAFYTLCSVERRESFVSCPYPPCFALPTNNDLRNAVAQAITSNQGQGN
jgi:hypothetical protein